MEVAQRMVVAPRNGDHQRAQAMLKPSGVPIIRIMRWWKLATGTVVVVAFFVGRAIVRSARVYAIDVGPISEGWLAEQSGPKG
jgi:hypothetical protein